MSKNTRQAVVIGINDYRDPDIPKLSGAVNDASEIRKRLSEYGQFEISDDHFLTNTRANYQSIRKSISDLLWRADPCDLALFYFSGHGFQDGYGNGYIAPYDMVKSEPFIFGINMRELKQIVLNSVNKQCVLVVLDCCYSGIPTLGDKAIPDIAQSFDPYFSGTSKEEYGEGRVIIASSGEDQKSREIELKISGSHEPLIHGSFTYHLLEGLDGKAADEAGSIYLNRLYNYVEEILIKEGKQKPKFYAAGVSQLEKIKIAVMSQQMETYINSNLQTAEDALNQDTPFALIKAAMILQEVLTRSNDNASALQLQDKIDEALNGYRTSVNDWLFENEMDLSLKIRNLSKEFNGLVSSLKYQRIITLDQRKQRLLAYLCMVSLGIMDTETFIERVQPYDNPVRTSGAIPR
jgi:uncharacterized caspase-like protein